MDREPVCVERVGSAIVLTINRPQAANAIDLATGQALGYAIAAAEQSDARAIVVTGAGERFFCAGGDLKAYKSIETSEELDRTFGTIRAVLQQIEQTPVTVIAAINGYALGGGLELALACDLRIATRQAQLGMPQSRLGIIPGWNGAERLVETVGRSKALHLLLTGEQLDAGQAAGMGLVDRVVDGSALEAGIAYADELQQSAPLALRASKQVVMSALRDGRSEAEGLTSDLFRKLWFSMDHREAERAFTEKRRPRFEGK